MKEILEKIYVNKKGEVLSKRSGTLRKRSLWNDGSGYPMISIDDKRYRIHRLVAMAYLANPLGHKLINHKDGNKQNNNVNNLEWCSATYNCKHAYNTGLRGITPKMRLSLKKNRYRTEQPVKFEKDGVVKKFGSIVEAASWYGVARGSVSRYLKGKRKNPGFSIIEPSDL